MGQVAVPAGEAVIRIDPTAFIAPGAVVLGDVTLAARASVWYGAVLRGDMAPIVLGEASNIQDGTIVHVDEDKPARIGARVGVGHRAILHGCTVEDDCLIGMGSILLNDVWIGAGSVVAAGAVVPEGTRIPPGLARGRCAGACNAGGGRRTARAHPPDVGALCDGGRAASGGSVPGRPTKFVM